MPAFGGVRQRKKDKFTRRVGQVCVLGKSWMYWFREGELPVNEVGPQSIAHVEKYSLAKRFVCKRL